MACLQTEHLGKLLSGRGAGILQLRFKLMYVCLCILLHLCVLLLHVCKLLLML